MSCLSMRAELSPIRNAAIRCGFLCVVISCLQIELASGQQYTPESAKVQQMVNRGVKFLESDKKPPSYSGEPVLVGYTILKVTGDAEHPLVKSGIRAAQSIISTLDRQRDEGESKVVYESSISAVLLASVDPGKYQPELLKVLYFFTEKQKSHGGFGYLGMRTGDTSQVQYVMLALWTMNEVGIDIPAQLVEDTMRYLMLTMDPSGAWGYQGKVAQNRLLPQDKVSKSLATAGAGALIIGGDILRFFGTRKKKNDEDEGIPEAFVRIDLKEKERRLRGDITMSRSDIENPINSAIRYHGRVRNHTGNWYYYWRYSQERYESFLEIMNNRQEKSPGWYNEGVNALAKVQDDSGAWGKRLPDVTSNKVSTSFAILFLIRSTQKAIGKLDEGVTFGGYELPTDVSTVKMVGDRLVSDEETSVENLLAMLEDDEASKVQIGLLPENLQLTDDPAQRKEQVARLSRLLSSGDYKARQIAAKLLGRTDDINVAPDLIYALTDPNDMVPMIAEESLRLLSRKLDAGALKQNPSGEQRLDAEKYWKDWYLGLRPEYIFIDR